MSGGIRFAIHRWPVDDAAARLADRDVVVFCASLLAEDAAVGRLADQLSPDEQSRFGSFTNAVVARRYAVARATLREILGAVLDVAPSVVPIRHGLHGKPALARNVGSRHVWFSVAHAEDLALIALSRSADVGIDLERSRSIEQWERVADRVLDPVERVQLRHAVDAGSDAGTAFLRHWCRVEAELKAIGCGIAGLEAHRAGKRPLGFRWADLGPLPLPPDVEASGARYQAAVALCAPGVESARHSAVAANHDTTPTITPASASTP
ncbi:MAG: 4'-phosphopantetheinyl transferase family protein [Gemmatimonadaceae bacterium]